MQGMHDFNFDHALPNIGKDSTVYFAFVCVPCWIILYQWALHSFCEDWKVLLWN